MIALAAVAAMSFPLAVAGPRAVLADGNPRHYHFVSAPPGVTAEPVPPTAQTFQIQFGPEGSPEREIATVDIQASLQLPAGAIEVGEGSDGVAIEFAPFAPDGVPREPDGYRVLGNVYRIEVREMPGDDDLERFAKPVGLGLLYPQQLAPAPSEPQPVIIRAADGAEWLPVETDLSVGASFTQARIREPAWFAVAVPDPDAHPAGGGFPWLLTAAIAGGVVLVAALVVVGRRRRGGPPAEDST